MLYFSLPELILECSLLLRFGHGRLQTESLLSRLSLNWSCFLLILLVTLQPVTCCPLVCTWFVTLLIRNSPFKTVQAPQITSFIPLS